MIAGIDVGKISFMAVLKNDKIVYLGKLRFDLPVKYVGIDAPLNLPERGFRKCEKKLLNMGIRVIPPLFLKKIHKIGVEIAKEFEKRGAKVYEVYPYATRYVLGWKWSKRSEEGRKNIVKGLKEFLDFPETDDHNEIDAIISALTVKFYIEGYFELCDNFILPSLARPLPKSKV